MSSPVCLANCAVLPGIIFISHKLLTEDATQSSPNILHSIYAVSVLEIHLYQNPTRQNLLQFIFSRILSVSFGGPNPIHHLTNNEILLKIFFCPLLRNLLNGILASIFLCRYLYARHVCVKAGSNCGENCG
jgi:hypothetical protein